MRIISRQDCIYSQKVSTSNVIGLPITNFLRKLLVGNIPIPLKAAAVGGRFLNPALPSAVLPSEAKLPQYTIGVRVSRFATSYLIFVLSTFLPHQKTAFYAPPVNRFFHKEKRHFN
jgi:hypothetical protein